MKDDNETPRIPPQKLPEPAPEKARKRDAKGTWAELVRVRESAKRA